MFKRFLIVASKLDKAGINITSHMSQFGNFDFYLAEKKIIYTENLDLEKINSFDFIIFTSKHKSKENRKTLSIHPPGNFRDASYGGIKEKVCISSALFQKFLFEKLNKKKKEFGLNNYELTLEATHHGPLIEKPCVFVEIGSSENEWKDRRAGFVVAKAIVESINEFKENPYHEVVVGIGGPHYCPNFNKLQLNSNIAVSHVIPGYLLPLTKEMIKEAISKTFEEVDFVILDWKGVGKAEERDQLLKILSDNYIQHKKTSEVNK